MGYDLYSNQRRMYVELHQAELYAVAAEARLARQARVPRRLRRRLGTLLISAGEALVYQPCEALCGECRLAGAPASVHKHL